MVVNPALQLPPPAEAAAATDGRVPTQCWLAVHAYVCTRKMLVGNEAPAGFVFNQKLPVLRVKIQSG